MSELNRNNEDNNVVEGTQIEEPLESPIEEPTQIDLFADILGEAAPATQPSAIPASTGTKKMPGSSTKSSSTKANVSKPSQPTPPKVYGTDWTIAYAGVTIGLSKEMTEEEIHQFVERDYPELSKRRSRINFDATDKIITFSVTGAKKG